MSPDGSGGEPQVLMVDDEKEVADAYALRLRDVGTVAVAYSGAEALEYVEAADEPTPDIVLLDRHMPGLSGDEVLTNIREQPLQTRVVMVTAIDPELDILDLPFDDYLCKPVDRADVHTVVEQQCEILAYQLLGEYFEAASKREVLRAELQPDETASHDRLADVEGTVTQLRDRIERLLPRSEADDVLEGFAAVAREGQ
ncbi:MAG: CheY-like chemotaxis protein [Natronomonas sp.]|jgi:CheY-like chemotaxis protein